MGIPAKAESLGGEWTAVMAMIFTLLTGFALGSITTYLIAQAVKGPIVVAGTPPTEPAAETHVIKGRGK